MLQSLIVITDDGATSPGATTSHSKPIRGASLVQKRSQIEKRSEEVFDEDEEGHDTHRVGSKDINPRLAADWSNQTKSIDPALTAKTGEAANVTTETVKAKDQRRSSIDAAKPQHVAIRSVSELLSADVGNHLTPILNASGARNSSGNSSHHGKWPSWLLVAVARCSKTLDDVCGHIMKLLVQFQWVSDSTGRLSDDPEGSTMFVGLGFLIALTIFVALMCVHGVASRQALKEDLEDSSTAWFRHLDDSSPFSSPSRHPWFFRCLGFSWTSRFSPKPMPPYSVRSEQMWM